MMLSLDFLPTMVFAVVMLAWFAFVVLFLARKKPPSPPDSKRARISIWGIALQGISYAIVWSVHRSFFTPIAKVGKQIELIVAGLTMILAIGSVWFVLNAMRPPRKT